MLHYVALVLSRPGWSGCSGSGADAAQTGRFFRAFFSNCFAWKSWIEPTWKVVSEPTKTRNHLVQHSNPLLAFTLGMPWKDEHSYLDILGHIYTGPFNQGQRGTRPELDAGPQQALCPTVLPTFHWTFTHAVRTNVAYCHNKGGMGRNCPKPIPGRAKSSYPEAHLHRCRLLNFCRIDLLLHFLKIWYDTAMQWIFMGIQHGSIQQ